MMWACVIIVCIAQITDHLDGWVARRNNAVSLNGWLFDSVSDRSFYIAAILAFEREYGVADIVVWAFVLREICLYATRVTMGDFKKRLSRARFYALVHAGLIRLVIVLACVAPLFGFHIISIECITIICDLLLSISTLLGFATLWLIIRG